MRITSNKLTREVLLERHTDLAWKQIEAEIIQAYNNQFAPSWEEHELGAPEEVPVTACFGWDYVQGDKPQLLTVGHASRGIFQWDVSLVTSRIHSQFFSVKDAKRAETICVYG